MFRHLHKVTTAHLVIVLIISLSISAWTLRQNNQRMGVLREAVIVADEKNADVREPLAQLSEHIFSHMNTDMSQPIELVSGFNRAVDRARKAAEKVDVGNTVYADAQAECEVLSIPLNVRAQCIQDFVLERAKPGSVVTKLDIPPKELFVYDYQSPVWSPDIAGFSVLLSAFITSLLVTKLFVSRKKLLVG